MPLVIAWCLSMYVHCKGVTQLTVMTAEAYIAGDCMRVGMSCLPCLAQVRGSSSPVEELAYIIRKTQCSGLFVDDASILDKLLPSLTGKAAASNGAASNGASANGAASNGSSGHKVSLSC